MARTVDKTAPPSLAHPGGVVRHAGRAFKGDRVFRQVVAVNIVCFAAFAAFQFVLDVPRVMEPLVGLLVFFPMAAGQWRFWRWADLDTRAAVALVAIHRKAFKDDDPIEKLEHPDILRGEHFRVQTQRPYTLGRAARRATYIYGISIALGTIFSTFFLPINLGQALTIGQLAVRSTAVAFLTVFAAFALGWIMAPIWLIEDSGVRYFSRKMQTLERVSRWYLNLLGPVLGVGTIGTFFLVYYIAGFTLVDAIIALVQLSITFYPAALTATFLYQKYREDEAVAKVKGVLEEQGLKEYGSIVTALVRLPP